MSNGFATAVPPAQLHSPIHALLRAACSDHADRVAIECGDRVLRYSEFLDRAEQIRQLLASRLQGRPGVVAVCGHRSVDVIAAAMAVWTSGHALMLVDEALPQQRRELMLSCVPTRAVVSCGEEVSARSLSVAEAQPAPGAEGQEARVDGSDDHAYIAFTSGSTGRPKAILGSHNGLSHFLQWQSREFGVAPGERFAHLTNLSFDVWFRDALTPLISGATLCIPTSPQMGAQALFEFLRSRAITALHVVPSIANLWINAERPGAPIESLRRAFFAGEPLEGVLVRKWREVFPACQIVNLYGPTETTLAKHFKRIGPDVPDGVQPVGLNLPGSVSYVLDDELRPCPHGALGEICIATPYRSHGYLTPGGLVPPYVEVSIPPVGTVSVYRTGDLGKRNQEGDLEILGRKDDQIKINGVRIELLEVKSAIASHPCVREVFVCARQERYTKSIVAVVEAEAGIEATLLAHLRQSLPPVMVPSRIHLLPSLPRLPNGKLDRPTLTSLATRPDAPAPAPVPGTGLSVASRVERIWQELLGPAGTARHRNFFEAGGNSISIVELQAKFEQEFKVQVPLVRLFEHTTIDAQARFVGDLLGRPGSVASSPAPVSRAAFRERVIAGRSRTARQSNAGKEE